MKIDLNEIELGYLNELIELEQVNNLNTDPKNKNNIMVNELVKKLTIPAVVGRSEQLVLFADWLQYNGKWDLPETQVKNFLKEQEQN